MGSSYSCCKTCACPQQKDTAPGRRQILSEKGIDRYLQDYPHDAHKNVKVTTQYVEKPSGQLAHCKLFEPKNPSDAKGMICYAIGFGDHVDWNNHDTGCIYADLGFIVFMVEYKGHGRSDGEYAVIDNFEKDIVDETIWMFLQAIDRHIKPHPVYSKSIDEKNNYFLGGKSMGGAVSILIALKLQKQKFNPFKGTLGVYLNFVFVSDVCMFVCSLVFVKIQISFSNHHFACMLCHCALSLCFAPQESYWLLQWWE